MRFSHMGGLIQQMYSSEGGILKGLGLLEFHTSDDFDFVEVKATYALRSLFHVVPSMKELYPLLVEFTMRFRYPTMVDRADIEARLLDVGMAKEGLEKLNLTLRAHYQIWTDF
jgi:hypothetical protein